MGVFLKAIDILMRLSGSGFFCVQVGINLKSFHCGLERMLSSLKCVYISSLTLDVAKFQEDDDDSEDSMDEDELENLLNESQAAVKPASGTDPAPIDHIVRTKTFLVERGQDHFQVNY